MVFKRQVVFGGYSADSLAGRILDCQSEVLLTCSAVQRGNKVLPLKNIVDEALKLCKDKENFQIGEIIFELPMAHSFTCS